MTRDLRSAVAPLYILLCIVLGGSIQGVWGVAALQLLAIAIIGWSLMVKDPLGLTDPGKRLFALAGLAIGLVAVQLIPLPPAIWAALPGRAAVAAGFALLGQPLPWLPISLAPYETAATVLTLLPPLAVLAAMLVAGAYRASWVGIAILAGTLAAVVLGQLQVASANPATSPWYWYDRTNYGLATGFFANSNHMAALLVISIPVLAAAIADLRKRARNARARSSVPLLAIAGCLVLLVGIYLNGSLAALLLGLPVVMVSAAILLPHKMRLRKLAAGVALAGIAATLLVHLSPLQTALGPSTQTSVHSRQTMWATTVSAIGDHGLLGSGLGSFAKLYPEYEDPATIVPTIVNHAHNDYLELVLETGVPGLILLVAFLLWWAGRMVPIWRSAAPDPYAMGASIASAALLVHSLVDYPLRTAALSSIFAACLALMVRPRARDSKDRDDLWSSPRHMSV